MEQLKAEGTVDIFQVVKTLRIQRPGSVPSVVSAVQVLFSTKTVLLWHNYTAHAIYCFKSTQFKKYYASYNHFTEEVNTLATEITLLWSLWKNHKMLSCILLNCIWQWPTLASGWVVIYSIPTLVDIVWWFADSSAGIIIMIIMKARSKQLWNW